MIPKTCVTTVRTDLRDIAKIAMFISKQNYPMMIKSKGSIVALATRLLASQLKDYKVDMTEDAIKILRSLGYGESLQEGKRDYKPLLRQMSLENIEYETSEQAELQDSDDLLTCAGARKEKQNATKPSAADLEAAKSIIAVEPEAEPEQLKTRTAADEQKDIKRFKKGLGTIPEEVISGE